MIMMIQWWFDDDYDYDDDDGVDDSMMTVSRWVDEPMSQWWVMSHVSWVMSDEMRSWRYVMCFDATNQIRFVLYCWGFTQYDYN